QVIELNPNHNEAWALLERLIKAALFNEGLNRRGDDRYGQGFTQTIQAGYHFALLQYYLDAFRPHEADASYDAALGALPDRGAVPGPAQDGKPPVLFEQTIALLHFGRSGTGLVHSLIDSHPEVSTVPSVYLSGYFNDGLWKELSAGPIETLPDRFAQNFAVMFDATSLNLTPSSNPEGIAGLGVKEGMTDVGEDHDRSLSVDREVFCDEARRLMAQFGSIDAGQFLQIAHAAYETALGRTNDKHTLFYHIHNPNRFAKLNFLRHQPDARLIMMIRDPVQSCESWVRRAFEDGQYMPVLLRILTMLYDIDQVAFRRHDCVGVRLEDLKRKPEATMKALCQWIGIAENPCLYEMTAQGEKWWGDHSSPDYDKKKQMTPFDDAGLKRPGRAIFSETDLFLLETLFYPFSVRFGYKEPDPGGFKQNLKEVRALLGGSLDIEKVIVDKTDVDREQFERQNDYLRFRAGLIDRLDVLDEVGEYPHMLAPLNVSKKI
ncbi:MAG: hypothetical protein HOL37_08420, partial [Rhodospirillaceae bacterium]|nr:hypothetical protein [Rhodospirillaceae bacterium]